MTGAQDISRERQRQIESLGYTAEHDAQHPVDLLSWAAASLATAAAYGPPPSTPPTTWPPAWRWNPGHRREALVKAGALLAAAIDRLDDEDVHTDRYEDWDLDGPAHPREQDTSVRRGA